MAVRLTPLDQLQLLATGRSLVALGRAIGRSPRSVGRYLRGETRIPDAVLPDLAYAYRSHASVVREQAQTAGLPLPDVPVSMVRTVREDGTPGESVKFNRVHFLSPTLREKWVKSLYKTKRFSAVRIGSRYDIYVYTRTDSERANRGGYPKFRVLGPMGETEGKFRKLEKEWTGEVRRKRTSIGTAHDRQMDIYGRRVAFGQAANSDRAQDNIEAELSRAHSRGTPPRNMAGASGPIVGHTWFFKLAEFENQPSRGKRAAKRMRQKGRC